MTRKRKTDANDSRFFRMGDRISVVNGKWFITLREGEEGPFASREQAERRLRWLLESWGYGTSFTSEQEAEEQQRTEHEAKRTADLNKESKDRSIWDRQINMR